MMTFLVQIEKLVAGGDGLARHEGRVVFVPGTAPGETHRVELREEKKDYVKARSVECVEASPERREPPCPYYGRCGGCSVMHLSPEAQLRAKRGILIESLERKGVSPGVVNTVSSPEAGYRTRLRLHVSRRDDQLSMGFRQRGSHRVEDIERCLLASDRLNEIWQRVRAWVRDDSARARELTSIELQESSHEPGRVCARFVVRSVHGIRRFDRKQRNALLSETSLEGVVLAAPGGGREVRAGRPFVHHRVFDRVLRQSAGSFFQANRFLLEKLVSAVAPGHPPKKVPRLVDLYCGVGFFAIPLAAMASEIVGVEASPTAKRDASANARAAGHDQIRFFNEDAARFAQSFRFSEDDFVVLDPPRGGLPRSLRESLAGSPLHGFCYVSCDPPALGRDAALFHARGFRIEALTLLDLFPNTHHFETIALFSRKEQALDILPREVRQ